VPRAGFADDLHQVRLGRRPHPRVRGAVVRRQEDHAVLQGHVAGPPAFAPLLPHVLPAVRPVAVQADQQVGFLRRVQRLRQQLHAPLHRPVQRGAEFHIPRRTPTLGSPGRRNDRQSDYGQEGRSRFVRHGESPDARLEATGFQCSRILKLMKTVTASGAPY